MPKNAKNLLNNQDEQWPHVQVYHDRNHSFRAQQPRLRQPLDGSPFV